MFLDIPCSFCFKTKLPSALLPASFHIACHYINIAIPVMCHNCLPPISINIPTVSVAIIADTFPFGFQQKHPPILESMLTYSHIYEYGTSSLYKIIIFNKHLVLYPVSRTTVLIHIYCNFLLSAAYYPPLLTNVSVFQ